MEDIKNKILALDDNAAIMILDAFAQTQQRRGAFETELDTPLRQALSAEFQLDPPRQEESAVGKGELARQALLVLLEHPVHGQAIRTMAASPSSSIVAKSFGVVETAAVTTAVLIALQTHVKFERGKDGKIVWKIEKKPTSAALLKPLVAKLLAFLGGA